MSRYSGVVRARSLRLATHLHCRLARRASHLQAETICIPIPSSLLGTGPARSSDLLPVKATPDSFEVAHRLSRHPSSCSGYICHRLPPAALTHTPTACRCHQHAPRPHPPATARPPPHPAADRHKPPPPARHAHSQSSSTQRRSQSSPLISPPAVRRAGLLALRRLPATPQPPRTEPLREPTPQPLPVGPPPPYPDRAAIPRQLVSPPAVADPIPLRRAR